MEPTAEVLAISLASLQSATPLGKPPESCGNHILRRILYKAQVANKAWDTRSRRQSYAAQV